MGLTTWCSPQYSLLLIQLYHSCRATGSHTYMIVTANSIHCTCILFTIAKCTQSYYMVSPYLMVHVFTVHNLFTMQSHSKSLLHGVQPSNSNYTVSFSPCIKLTNLTETAGVTANMNFTSSFSTIMMQSVYWHRSYYMKCTPAINYIVLSCATNTNCLLYHTKLQCML